MTTKHTPGPWRVIDDTPEELNAKVYGKGREHVANVWSGSIRTHQAALANARLIAAAPELLSALQTLAAEEYRDDDDEVLIAARDKARAAIARATQD